jgi:transcription-repair coupling factor (superfamily II helicase)
MPEEQLEKVMTDFMAGKYDILVTTTIIQLGLDMPNVNTLIVDQADRFGLGQLYQLRGRVGRGINQAYAYFFFDEGKQLTPQAYKRLRTIFEATELGSGFGIAMKDLEIRGAGNLLGVKQSGHIAALGFDLYCQLLAEAVEELKASPILANREAEEECECQAPERESMRERSNLPAYLCPWLPTYRRSMFPISALD